MNKEAIAAELPAGMVEWLGHAEAPVWDVIARQLVLDAGHRLLMLDGEAGWYAETRDALLRDASPAVRAIAARLPLRGERWYATEVADEVLTYFDLPDAWYTRLRRTLAKSTKRAVRS